MLQLKKKYSPHQNNKKLSVLKMSSQKLLLKVGRRRIFQRKKVTTLRTRAMGMG